MDNIGTEKLTDKPTMDDKGKEKTAEQPPVQDRSDKTKTRKTGSAKRAPRIWSKLSEAERLLELATEQASTAIFWATEDALVTFNHRFETEPGQALAVFNRLARVLCKLAKMHHDLQKAKSCRLERYVHRERIKLLKSLDELNKARHAAGLEGIGRNKVDEAMRRPRLRPRLP